ncbi:hypothetical protein [Bacillus sp. ISL-37]|jgi:hypothetical protein|uniref:hypothetical protein n=1 Tax=Bacillus sp. ISL-37 TaxID=2819123 RepID=UPI001BE93F45|nr:hypothetical protein [Bacillus sp. ISL-37]MBT2682269.1 hypothetical protein [Bacillus sp. ISL-37]
MKYKKVFMRTVLVIASLIMIGRDYYLTKEDRPPNFSIQADTYKDGGTKVYLGLGYKVIDYNQLDGRKDVVFIPFYLDIFEIK